MPPVGAWGGVDVRRVAVRIRAATSAGGKRAAACVGYGASGEWSVRHSLTGLQVGAKSEKRYRGEQRGDREFATVAEQ